MGIATAMVKRLTPMKLKTITGGPPEVTPTINTPLRAVHLTGHQLNIFSTKGMALTMSQR